MMRNGKFSLVNLFFLVFIGFMPLGVMANVVINGTRIIYHSDKKEVTVKAENSGKSPALVQVWIDDGNEEVLAQDNDAPFVITPPLIRLNQNDGQSFRIIYIPGQVDLPKDRESIYYFNLLDIPPSPEVGNGDASSFLQFAVRSRIKLFYRPSGLKGEAYDAVSKLSWNAVNGADGSLSVNVSNDSEYYISFDKVIVEGVGGDFEVESSMLPPKSSAQFRVLNEDKNFSLNNSKIKFGYINDYGSISSGEASLK